MRSLLEAQHPDLARLPLSEVAGGWEFRMWRLGDHLAIRLPRWETSPVLLKVEWEWLPRLAPNLPLPVPTPRRAGKPTAEYPLPWSIVEWVPGTPADLEPVTDRASIAVLAQFLRALHTAAPDDAPVNPGRYGIPIGETVARFDEGLSVVDDSTANRLQAIWRAAVDAPPWSRGPRWVHGDLIPANIVVANGALCGVIDFGELCVGDPANDLEVAWTLLPDGTSEEFFDAYGLADDATIARAQGWAALRALSLISIGNAGDEGLANGKPTWGSGGRAAIQRLLS